MLEKCKYEEQIKRFKTKIQHPDDMVQKIIVFLEDKFSKKCPAPELGYNAVNFNIENHIYMEISLCWVQCDENGNHLALLKLRQIEINPKYRNNGCCTSIVKFLEEIALIHKYDGIEIECICSEEMYSVAKKLNYSKLASYMSNKESDYIGSYRKLF